MNGKAAWLAPLTGTIFVVVVIVGFLIGGEPPDPDNDPADIAGFYVDNETVQAVGALLAGIAATALVFFGGYLRRVLQVGAGRGEFLSTVAMGGLVIYAAGIALDATIVMALVSTADDVDPIAIQTLSAFYENDFMLFAVGTQVFLLAAGVSIVQHATLPKWLGWVAIVTAVIAVTPIGFVSFFVGLLWILVVSIVLTTRARSDAPA